MKNIIRKIVRFLKEVRAEMKKVAWSGRKELGDSTLLVVVAVIIIAGLVGIFDAIWWWILQFPWLFGK